MSFSNQSLPKIQTERSTFDYILEVATLLALAFCVFYLFMVYGDLPDSVPSHINAKGKVDGYASKSFLWIFLVIGFVTLLGMQLLLQIPHKFNYLVKITKENAKQQNEIALQMMRFINLLVAIIWLYSLLMMLGNTNVQSFNLPMWGLWILIGLTMVGPVFYMIKSSNQS